MKDSGIEWIGQIPENINVIRNKYLIKYEKGKLPKDLNTEKIGIPYVGASELEDLSGEAEYATYTTDTTIPQCDSSDVLVLWDGARAGLIGTNHKGAVSSTIVNTLPVKEIDKRFWYWYLKAFQQHLYNRVNGTTIPHMNTDYIEEIAMLDWKTEEQIRIAHFLDTKCAEIDALIAAKEKTNALLKERRQSIIYEAVTKGLNPDAPMKDSGIEWIGQIPENWGIAALKRVATPSTGMTPSKANSQYWEGDIPWFSSKDIKADYLFDSEDHISQQAVDECGLTVHDENSVVFCARSGILRHTFPVSVLKCKGTINQDLRVLATSETIDPEFLMYYLRGMNNTIVTLYQKVGATVESIEMEWLLYLPVALPPMQEQKEIAEYIVTRCNEIDSQIAANEISVQKLKEYRQSVIYEAVTGKIEI